MNTFLDTPSRTDKNIMISTLLMVIEEIQYLLDNDFIEPSESRWSSPCVLYWNLMGHLTCVQTTVK